MLPLRQRPLRSLPARLARLSAFGRVADRPAKASPELRRLRSSAMVALAGGAVAIVAAGVALDEAGLHAVPLAQTQAMALYAAVSAGVLLGLSHHLPHLRFGAANSITLARAVLVCLLGGAAGHIGAPALSWLPLAAAVAVLCLDGVDGWAARRTGGASRFGARFDMEVDALFLLVLCAFLAGSGKAGPWVFAAALIRYLFLVSGWLLPWLRRELPPLLSRKVAFVVSAGLLLISLAPPMMPPLSTLAAALAVVLVAASFIRDILWLHRRRAEPLLQ